MPAANDEPVGLEMMTILVQDMQNYVAGRNLPTKQTMLEEIQKIYSPAKFPLDAMKTTR